MAIQTICPSCRTDFTLTDELAGKTVRCKKCNTAFVVLASKGRAETNGDKSDADRGSDVRASIQTRPQPAKRAPAQLDEDDDRPRRRRRDDDDDEPPSIRHSNRGLMIGLIVGGIGLMVLLGGGVVVAVLLIAGGVLDQGFSGGDSWPQIGPAVAPPNSAVLHISGVADENTRDAVIDQLHALVEAERISLNSSSQGDRMTVFMTPVHDVQAFSQKLGFGTVDSVKGNVIRMTANKVEGPAPNADAVTRALAQLRSTSSHKRWDAIRKLKDMLPDERRSEVVKALEPLLNAGDLLTRRSAVEAIGVWGNKDAVPILLKAMRDKDTRGEAMKALGRLKDERAAEPIAERLEEFFDRHEAEVALKAMGPVAEKAVLARLNHHDWQVRTAACDVLSAIGTKQSIPPLEKVIAAGKDPFAGQDHLVAKSAERALKAIKARQ